MIPRIVLASASPRRAAILASLHIPFAVDAPQVDETALDGEDPVEHALRLSNLKAEAVATRRPSDWVLGGDTVVTIDGTILGKPRDRDHAVDMLLRLEGRTHEVVSALTLIAPPEAELVIRERPRDDHDSTHSGATVTAVTFRAFGTEVAEAYADTGEPLDKAGAYGIQEAGAALVERVDGDYSAVVGLPVPLLLRLMEAAGIPYRFGVAP
jgi:septum formation protein